MPCDLSIVIPTCNRASLLDRCLHSIRENTACEYEIIVVDGASTDHTPAILSLARELFGERLTVIREPRREGFVRAANKGFAQARGRCLTWLNDDARPLPGAFDNAVMQINSSTDVALLALFHRWHHTRNVAYETVHDGKIYRLCHVRGTLYANFAMGLREMFSSLGFFDEGYYLNGADPDLSLKAWHAGLRVEPAYGALIDHDETTDDRRFQDSLRAGEDNQRLFAKWDLPARNPTRNDFDPRHPNTLRGLREPLSKILPAPSTVAA